MTHRLQGRPWLVLLVALGLAGPAAAQQVYRCDVGGRTTYADKPCADGSRQSVVEPPPVVSPEAQAAAQARSDRLIREAEVADARREAAARAAEQRADALRLQQLRSDEARALADSASGDLEAPIVRRRRHVLVDDRYVLRPLPRTTPQTPAVTPVKPTGQIHLKVKP
ncbi:DUF4124 domain-containing protein [Derxia lacustris]|uniref:DUF4124 domain-containing protein n=1 Tax=Derxia lacustris TaxID=764842 RepID=UPI000A16E7D7|nr:DUF4124 domain-containing protein [Derxia lacustris]